MDSDNLNPVQQACRYYCNQEINLYGFFCVRSLVHMLTRISPFATWIPLMISAYQKFYASLPIGKIMVPVSACLAYNLGYSTSDTTEAAGEVDFPKLVD